MNAFRISEDCTFVSKELLLQHISASTVNNGISIYKKGESKNWATIELQNGEFLQWESLTQLIRKRVGDIDEILTDAFIADSEIEANNPINDIELILDLAFTQARIYSRYFQAYQDRYLYSHEILKYSRMHSFIDSIVLMKKEGVYTPVNIHKAVCNLMKKRKLYNFKVGSFKYFKDKINLLSKGDVISYVIHGNKGRPKENIKLTSFVKKQLVKFYVQNTPRRLSYTEITDAVNVEILKFGYPSIHLSSTKKYLALPDIQNRFKPFRLGKEWAKKHLDPFIVRAHPLYIHDKWEIDGTVLPFYVLVNNKITRLWLCIVVDVHSRKIIGYGVDYHETANLIFNTYRVAIVNCRCVPFEIVRDNAKAFDSKLICELENSFESDEFKCFVRKAKVGNARDKGTVEKVLDILNIGEFSKCDGWIGDPWDSDRELYRLESTVVTELRKKVNIKEIPTVFNYVETAIKNLNDRIF
jgi:hypothetical protein